MYRFDTRSDAQTACESAMDVLKGAERFSVSHLEGEQGLNLYGFFMFSDGPAKLMKKVWKVHVRGNAHGLFIFCY